MVTWQVTATTICCDAVDDEVTIMVYKDGSVRCTGYQKYFHPDREVKKLLERKSKKLRRKVECQGLDCYRVVNYKNKLFAGESAEVTPK